MQQDSVEVARKICYEIHMLHLAYDRLCQINVETSDIGPDRVDHKLTSGLADQERREASAWLECFLLHARVLRDFFADDPRTDDVAAIYFVPQWSSDAAKSELNSVDKVRLNKALAHLTTARILYDQSHDGWDVDSMINELCTVTTRFLTSLPDDKLSWFESLDEIERLNENPKSA